MSASQLPTARKAMATLRKATQATVPQAGQDAPTAHPGPQARLGAGLVVDRYRPYRRLGAGAFGTVWAAHDEHLDREVAVKIIPRERVVHGRFEREARAAARLSHPGIVTLFEATTDEHDAYLVSELVIGSTLDQLLQAGRLSDRDIAEIAVSLADALAHAHAQGIVHRDVKPSNVLVPERPSSPAHPAKLTDFGVARVIGGDALTHTGEVIGTAAYMAPEQAEGREVTASADLYALALIIYEALTGVNPVRTGTAAMRARRLGAHLPPLRRQRRDLPPGLGRAIDRALRPRPRERGGLAELRAALANSVAEIDDLPGLVGGPWRSPRRDQPEGISLEPRDALPRASEAEASEPRSSAPHSSWPARASAALAAALLSGWLGAHLLAPSTVAPPALAIAAALLVLVLPRAGWMTATTAIAAIAAIQHRPGGALMVIIAAAAPVLLLPWRGTSWPLCAGAPALGIAGLAGAWPALAARIPQANAWRRAALGCTGWIWLMLASPISGTDLYVKLHSAAPPGWTSSLDTTLHGVLIPIVSSGALLAAPVWALAAVALPLSTFSRSAAINTILVVVWAALTVSLTEAAIALAHPAHGTTTIPTATIGALASVAIALAPTLLGVARRGLSVHRSSA